MSIYRTLKGYNIKSVTSDPANPKEGQIWFNNTINKIKANITTDNWASGGALGTGRYALSAGPGGTVTAGLAVFGRSTTGKTEEYDGTSWAEQNDGNTARYGGAKFGTQTAVCSGRRKKWKYF